MVFMVNDGTLVCMLNLVFSVGERDPWYAPRQSESRTWVQSPGLWQEWILPSKSLVLDFL